MSLQPGSSLPPPRKAKDSKLLFETQPSKRMHCNQVECLSTPLIWDLTCLTAVMPSAVQLSSSPRLSCCEGDEWRWFRQNRRPSDMASTFCAVHLSSLSPPISSDPCAYILTIHACDWQHSRRTRKLGLLPGHVTQDFAKIPPASPRLIGSSCKALP